MSDFVPPNTLRPVTHPCVGFDDDSPEGLIIPDGYSKRTMWTDGSTYTSDYGPPVVVDIYNDGVTDRTAENWLVPGVPTSIANPERNLWDRSRGGRSEGDGRGICKRRHDQSCGHDEQ